MLFICLGNICRSPLAEAVFRKLVRDAGLADRFDIDSAGTSGYHDGEGPDGRTVATAATRGLRVDHISRRVHPTDFERFQYLIVMDADNAGAVNRLRARHRPDASVTMLRSYDDDAEDGAEVPDPYFGGERGFHEVHDIVERACTGLLARIRAEHDL